MKAYLLAFWPILACPAFAFAQPGPLSNPSACNLGLNIPDDTCPNTYSIEVTGNPGTLGQDVFLREVRLIIAHTWTNDLDITLISPIGEEVILSSDNGGSADNYGDPAQPGCTAYVRFSDLDACTSIVDGAAPFLDGPYLPEQPLLQFNDGTTAANGIWTLRLCDDAGADVGTLEYVELIFAPLECLPPTDLQVASADTTSVVLDWQSPGDCATSIVEYGPPGFTPGTDSMPGGGTVVIGGCPPFLLEGLAGETTYEIYVRSYCQSEGFSANTCPIVHETGCDPPPQSLAFLFDGLPTCPGLCDEVCPLDGFWQNDTTDQQDWLVRNGPGGNPNTGPGADVSGTGRFLVLESTGNCPEGSEARLLSNCLLLDKQGSDTCHLSFHYFMWGTTVGTLQLEVSDDGGQNWTSLWSQTGNQGNRWRKAYVGLGDFADGTALQFRFVAVQGPGSLGDIALDEVVFYGSQDLGQGSLYFADQDGDGFGDPALPIRSCSGLPPGFVDNDQDCDDSQAGVNPSASELPCDGIDQNCNGMADDSLAPPPPVTSDTICSGELAEVCAQPLPGNVIVWYDSPDSQTPLAFGNCYSQAFDNPASLPMDVAVYAAQVGLCSSTDRAVARIRVWPQPDILVQDTPLICQGETYDLRNLTVLDQNFTGAELSFHTSLPPADQNEIDPPLVAPATDTHYYLQLSGAGGCTDVDSVVVRVRPLPDIVFSPADSFSLCLGAEEILTGQIANGSGPYQYLWNTGAQTPSILVAGSGSPGEVSSYQLTVSDELGCTAVQSAKVTTTTAIDSIRRQVQPVSTCGGSDGQIFLEPLNGLPPFSFSWTTPGGQLRDTSGIASTLLLDGVMQGTYSFTITDNSAQACSIILPSLVVNGPSAVLDTFFINDASCAGNDDGSIQLVVSGNNTSYLWSDGQTGPVAADLAAGSYSVTISESSCEIVLDSLEVGQPNPISIVAEYQPPTCFGDTDGAIAVAPFGGSGGYTYNWENGQSFLPFFDQLEAGTYSLQVQDQNACLLDTQLVLTQPDLLQVMTDSLAPPSCYGFADGLIALRAQGGVGPFVFQWAHGPSGSLQLGLPDGTYEVELTDANGCRDEAVYPLVQPDSLRLGLPLVQPPNCVGDSTGALSFQPAGGTPPYAYQWNTGDTTSGLTGLPVGLYELSLTDSRACPGDSAVVNLEALSSPLSIELQPTPPSCIGREDGMVAAMPLGNGPFSFQWSTGDTTAVIGGLGPDSLGLTVTDTNGCVEDTSLQLTAPQLIQIASSVVQPSCNGIEDGRITVNVVQGGGPGTSFVWADGAMTNQRTNLSAGSYMLTITNGQGCSLSPPAFVLAEPDSVNIRLLDLEPVSCHGDSSGFVALVVEGGTNPYELRLNGGPVDTSVFAELPAGTYQFTAQDANGCLDERPFVIDQPDPLEVSIEVDALDPCGSIDSIVLVADVEGGSGKYSYLWSNGAGGAVLVDPPPGDYSLTVVDGNGCTASTEEIKIPSLFAAFSLDSFSTKPVNCFGGSDGSAFVQVSGGSQQYIFHFSNNTILDTSANQVSLSDLPVDDHFGVTVTDAITGCVVASEDQDITAPSPLIVKRDSIIHPPCMGDGEGAVYTSTGGGTPPYTWLWTNAQGDVLDSVPDLTGLPEGTYFLQVTDSRGCRDSLSNIQIISPNEPLTLLDSLTQVVDVACRGDSTGRISLALTGGTLPYTYDWQGVDAEGAQATHLPAGFYSVLIEDKNGCSLIFKDFEITEPDEVLEVSVDAEDISCFGEVDGSVNALVEGGISPYQLVWIRDMMPIATDVPFLDGLSDGTYILAVEDEAGCIRAATATVQEPEPLDVTIQRSQAADTIILLAEVTGGTAPFSYLWTGGDTTQLITRILGGVYSVTVTDANQCTAMDSDLITSTAEKGGGSEPIRVFPNPVQNELMIDLGEYYGKEVQLQIFDAASRIVHTERLPNAAAQVHRLSTGNWPSGSYVLRFSAPESGRVLEQHWILKVTR